MNNPHIQALRFVTMFSISEAAKLLASHWCEQLDPLNILSKIFLNQLSELHVPPALHNALSNPERVCVNVISHNPLPCIAFVCAWRRNEGVASDTWELIKPYVTGHIMMQSVATIERRDLQRFGLECSRAIVEAGGTDKWVADLLESPWEAPPGTLFHEHLLQCCQIAGTPCVPSERPNIVLFNERGVVMLERDRVLIIFLLFFSTFFYCKAIPDSAPQSFHTAATAPWLTKIEIKHGN